MRVAPPPIARLTALAWLALAPAAAAQTPDSTGTEVAAPGSSESRGSSGTVAQRATRSAKAFASDLGYVVTSPSRLNVRAALWTAAVVGASAVVFANDEEVFRAFERSRGDPVYDFFLDAGERLEPLGHMGKTGAYWVGGAALSTLFRWDPGQRLCLDVIESHLVSGGVRNSAKFLVGRERPFEAGPYSFFKGGTSFPSGHASVVFEVATLVSRHTRRTPLVVRIPVGAVAYGVATAVCIQRVDSRGHWPSDMLISAASGAAIASTVSRRNEERRAAGERPLGVHVTPSGVVLAWSF